MPTVLFVAVFLLSWPNGETAIVRKQTADKTAEDCLKTGVVHALEMQEEYGDAPVVVRFQGCLKYKLKGRQA